MFKTYDMTKDDRYRYFGEVLNNDHLQQKIFYSSCALIILIDIVILIMFALLMFFKKYIPMKKMKKIGMAVLGVLTFLTIFGIGIYGLDAINSDKKDIKKAINDNTKHMRYITYDLKGKVNSIDESNDVQQIRFDDGKDNYRVILDSNVPISTGDDVEVKSNEKIPTSDDYNQKNLMNNTAKDTKITIVVNHDGKKQKNIREVKGKILYKDKNSKYITS